MSIKTTLSAALRICSAALAVGVLAVGSAVAGGHPVKVDYRVTTQGLDLSKPADVRELYLRLSNAAWIVCTRTNRVGLEPLPNPDTCADKALADSIRSSHLPQLVKAYLDKHSVAQATAQGFDVSLQVASK